MQITVILQPGESSERCSKRNYATVLFLLIVFRFDFPTTGQVLPLVVIWNSVAILFSSTMKTPAPDDFDDIKAEDIFGPSPASSSRTPTTPVGGVRKGKTSDNEKFRIVKVDAYMCRGKIRGNDVVCTKNRTCTLAHQGDGVFELGAEETILMVRRNATSAYSTLALRPELFDEDCLGYILSLRYTIDDWTSIIAIIEASPASFASPMTRSEFEDLLTDVKDNIQFMKTPFKTNNLNRKIFRDKEDDGSLGTYDDVLGGIRGVATGDKEFGFHRTEAFSAPASRWTDQAAAGDDKNKAPPPSLDERVSDFEDRIGSLEDFVEINSHQTMDNWAQCILFVKHIFTAIASILRKIGTRNFSVFPSEFAAADIWGTLYAIACGVQSSGASAMAAVTADVATMNSKVDTIEDKVDALPDHYVDPLDYRRLLAGIKGWGIRLSNLENKSVAPSAGDLFGDGSSSTVHPPVDTGAPDLADLLRAIDALTARLDKIEGNKDRTFPKFGGLVWKSIEDAVQFCVDNPVCVDNFGLMHDHVLIADLVWTEYFGKENFLKSITDLNKTKLKSVRNQIAVASFGNAVPKLYSDNCEPVTTQNQSSFSKFPKANMFTDDKVEQYERKCNIIQKSRKAQIEQHFRDRTSLGYTLCMLSLVTACAAFKEFNTWMAASFCLFQGHGMSDAKAWAITTRLGIRYFNEISEHRITARDGFVLDDMQATAASYLYTCLYSLTVTEEFRSSHFKDHPSVGNEMITYLMTIDELEDDSFDTKIKELEDKFNEKINSKINTVKTTAETAKRVADKAQNKVDNLATTVGKCATKEELKKYKKE